MPAEASEDQKSAELSFSPGRPRCPCSGCRAQNVQRVSRTDRTPSSEPHDMIHLRAFSDDEEPPADRIGAPQARLRISDAAVVDVDAAPPHKPPRLRFPPRP